MKPIVSLLCSFAFLICGGLAAITVSDPTPDINTYRTIQASTIQDYKFPVLPKVNTLDLSEDLVRDLAKQKGVLDTVFLTKTDTIKEQVTKVRVKKVPVPSNVMEITVNKERGRDTIQVPVYYLATQVGNKEGPTGCIPIYEVRKVDEICPDKLNSSVDDTTECHVEASD